MANLNSNLKRYYYYKVLQNEEYNGIVKTEHPHLGLVYRSKLESENNPGKDYDFSFIAFIIKQSKIALYLKLKKIQDIALNEILLADFLKKEANDIFIDVLYKKGNQDEIVTVNKKHYHSTGIKQVDNFFFAFYRPIYLLYFNLLELKNKQSRKYFPIIFNFKF